MPGFNVDAEMTLASMDRIEALLKESGAELWIQHDLALFESLDQAPLYHQ